MNKLLLMELMANSSSNYHVFIENTNKRTVSKKWGSGVNSPYSLEPYRTELLGLKPGKMLKKASEPAKGRYCYALDNSDRVIQSVEYINQAGPANCRDWIHCDNFYEYYDDHVIRYEFGNVFKDRAKLTWIVWAQLAEGRVIRCLSLGDISGDEYLETVYTYTDGFVSEIKITWPNFENQKRNFKVYHNNESVKITEYNPGTEEEFPVYPQQ